MTKPMAVSATFADFRIVKGRKVCQMVFETPIEQADEALKMLGGLPQPATERWCAIARMDMSKAASKEVIGDEVKQRRKFDSLPLPQQAALLCSQESFRCFLREAHNYNADTEDEAAEAVREICGVVSRSELTSNERAAGKFVTLQCEFEVWLKCPVGV
jgi:hypothetical protein